MGIDAYLVDVETNLTLKYRELSGQPTRDTSETVRRRVNAARAIQSARFADQPNLHSNACMESKNTRQFCQMNVARDELLRTAITKLGLSARAYDRILKVSRTIADLEGVDNYRGPAHLRGDTVPQPRPPILDAVRKPKARHFTTFIWTKFLVIR